MLFGGAGAAGRLMEVPRGHKPGAHPTKLQSFTVMPAQADIQKAL